VEGAVWTIAGSRSGRQHRHEMDSSAGQRDRWLDAALEASCEALLRLELIGAGAAAKGTVERHAREAAESLRSAIDLLRRARETRGHALAHGFVLGDPRTYAADRLGSP